MWIFAKALSVRNLLKKKNLENGKGMKFNSHFWDDIDYCHC